MVKSGAGALAILLSVMGTATAKTNPFSDVPADHWAYDAVESLVADGVIDGYGDDTFRGDKKLTRYEMAKMVARAMAKAQAQEGKDKALVDRLAAEFGEELSSLGVRVRELERHADNVKWAGKIHYITSYTSQKGWPTDRFEQYALRLEPSIEISPKWSAHARLEASGSIKKDSSGNARLSRLWVAGDYGNVQVALGKMLVVTNEDDMVFSAPLSGASISTTGKWQGLLFAGRFDARNTGMGSLNSYLGDWMSDVFNLPNNNLKDAANDPVSIWGMNLEYQPNRGLYGGLGYYELKSRAYNYASYNDISVNEGKVKVWSANLGYQFSPLVRLQGSYSKAIFPHPAALIPGWEPWLGIQDYSWQLKLSCGNYNRAAEKGQWAASIAYRNFGYLSSIVPGDSNMNDMIAPSSMTQYNDTINWGEKGWEFWGSWAFMKNVGFNLRLFKGKSITTGEDIKSVMTVTEFFF